MTTAVVKFAAERFGDVRDEIDTLLRLHYDEVALHKDSVPLAPDWGMYHHLDSTGGLKIFTARDNGLIGYAIFFIRHHLHYTNTLCAINDIVFLHPGHRKGKRTGVGLIRYADRELEAFGVDRIFWHVKPSKDFSPILHSMGYADEEKIVGRLVRK